MKKIDKETYMRYINKGKNDRVKKTKNGYYLLKFREGKKKSHGDSNSS